MNSKAMNSKTFKQHILLVDDDVDLARLLSFVLRAANFEVSHAATAQAAMSAVAGKLPDLFIIDLRMPEMDGDHLLHWLRRNRGATQPILMLTGIVKPGLDAMLRDAGADAVAHKPVDSQTIIGLVCGLLDR